MGFQHHDKEKLKELCSRAGKAKNPRKGFGSMSVEQRKVYGAKGGRKNKKQPELSTIVNDIDIAQA